MKTDIIDTRDENTTIEALRIKKAEMDKGRDVASILGCVGEPLADIIAKLGIEETPELIAACESARDNLVQMINDYRERAWDEAWEDAHTIAEHVACNLDIDDEISMSDSLEDIATRGADQVVSILSDNNGYPTAINVEDLY